MEGWAWVSGCVCDVREEEEKKESLFSCLLGLLFWFLGRSE